MYENHPEGMIRTQIASQHPQFLIQEAENFHLEQIPDDSNTVLEAQLRILRQ